MITNRDLERELGSWFEARATSAPPDDLLERGLARVDATRQRRGWLVPDHWRSSDGRMRPTSSPARVALAVVALLVALATAAAVGAWFSRQSNVVLPTVPTPSAAVHASPSPALPSPTVHPTPAPAGILGGGSILVRDIARDVSGTPLDTVHGFGPGTYDVSLVDPATGERTLLGTVPYDPHTGYTPELRWAADGRTAMITDRRGKLWSLDSPTPAGQAITFACCERPGVVAWTFSPTGDRIAGLAVSDRKVPGLQGEDEVVVSNIDGSGVRTLPLPRGADTAAAGDTLSWAPDESAVVVAGCRPCNYADPGKKPKNLTHPHLFIVPLDASPVRELLDETTVGVFDPTWSADGSTIVVGRNDCPPDEIQPYCGRGRLSVETVRVSDGRQTILAEIGLAPELVSSPTVSSVGRIAYATDTGDIYVLNGPTPARVAAGRDPRWSPDGTLLLFSDADGRTWIVSPDGGQPRPIGDYAEASW